MMAQDDERSGPESFDRAVQDFESGIARRRDDSAEQERFARWFAASRPDAEAALVGDALAARAAKERGRAGRIIAVSWALMLATLATEVFSDTSVVKRAGAAIVWIVVFLAAMGGFFALRRKGRHKSGKEGA
jgi:hypothetical protein